MVASNPFDEIRCGGQANEKWKQFVSQADTQRLLDACPDAEWRLLVCLSRLRFPSEIAGLTWPHVSWDAGTLLVHGPKTEHHEGQTSRTVPLFPEVRQALMEQFEAALPGETFVISARHRNAGANLRTPLERIIRKAGLKAWPKVWHNMRASRQSELMAEYDLATACRWLGNSPTVAARHYAMSTDRDGSFQRAIGQTAETSGAISGATVVQKVVQLRHAPNRTNQHVASEGPVNIDDFHQDADTCTSLHIDILGDTGFEPVTSCVSCMRSNQLS